MIHIIIYIYIYFYYIEFSLHMHKENLTFMVGSFTFFLDQHEFLCNSLNYQKIYTILNIWIALKTGEFLQILELNMTQTC